MDNLSSGASSSDDSAVEFSLGPTTPEESPVFSASRTDLLVDKLLPRLSDLDHSDNFSSAQIGNERPANLSGAAPTSDANIKEICFIGAGYVGAPTAAVIALKNPSLCVTVIDREQSRIRRWNSGHLPIREPGLRDVVRAARDGLGDEDPAKSRQSNLSFTTDSATSIAKADMIFIAVNTPTKTTGVGAGYATDLTAVESAVTDIAAHAKDGAILVEKSTVPCRTAHRIHEILDSLRPGGHFEILSNPEFLSEGTAVHNLLHPDRVIIGSSNTIQGRRAAAALANVYAAWIPRPRILGTNLWSSELAKLAANAMLAQRISSINSIGAVCEATGADVHEVAKSIGLDPRIGSQFLKAGLGFGGSCFKKDVGSLIYLARSLGLHEVGDYWNQVLAINDLQRSRFARKVVSQLNGTLIGKKITLLGFAFKKNTSDTRESVAVEIISHLLEEMPLEIAIFDPWCSPSSIEKEVDRHFGSSSPDPSARRNRIKAYADPYQACLDTNAALIITDWDDFRTSPTTAVPVSSNKPRTKKPLVSAKILQDGQKYLPEPSCQAECPDCNDSFSGLGAQQDFEWARISYHMKKPRWVFDGRG